MTLLFDLHCILEQKYYILVWRDALDEALSHVPLHTLDPAGLARHSRQEYRRHEG